VTIHTDCDVEIPDVTAYIDWYCGKIGEGCGVAYSRVKYVDLDGRISSHAGLAIHHVTRWIKRNLFRLPTTQGNFAIRRDLFEKLYREGRISIELQVGPSARLDREEVAYSSSKKHRILTSGRAWNIAWGELVPYFYYRLKVNLKALPAKWRKRHSGRWKGFEKQSDLRDKR